MAIQCRVYVNPGSIIYVCFIADVLNFTVVICSFSFNQAKPKTDVEARVYEVLSHKNWGSSSSLMHEVARDTFDMERFHVVTRLMWEGMENQRPAAWRVVFKALTLLEFLVKNGSERCVDDARNHGHILRSLGQFNYYEGTIDRGLGVREKSKQILEILSDDERIREERQKARKLREKFNQSGAAVSGGGGQYAGYGNQVSWNTGGGYGGGGIDSASPYESGGGYSGRYGGSRGNDSVPPSAGTPTFASIPDSKPKKTKKKKKKSEAAPAPPAPAPAPGMPDSSVTLGFGLMMKTITNTFLSFFLQRSIYFLSILRPPNQLLHQLMTISELFNLQQPRHQLPGMTSLEPL